MASQSTMMMISSASVMAPKWAVSSSPSQVGLSPFNVTFLPCYKKPGSSTSMMVRSQQNEYDSGVLIHGPVAVGGTGRVHSPYTITEDEDAVKVLLDMPGVPAEDVDVKVEGDTLTIKDMGRQLYSPYDTIIQIPPYVEKHDITATLINGVLHVSMPKKTILVPLTPAPTTSVEEQVEWQTDSVGMEDSPLPPVELEEWQNRTALLDFPNYVRIPWGHYEDDKEIRVSMDVPGLLIHELQVSIMGDLLVIDGGGEGMRVDKADDLGRTIPAIHAKLQLPKGCIKDQAHALLKSGILYITLPKSPVDLDSITPVDVPVKPGF